MSSFKPPSASAGQCNGIPFVDAVVVAEENKKMFDNFDQTKAKNDPSKCKRFLDFQTARFFGVQKWLSMPMVLRSGRIVCPVRSWISILDRMIPPCIFRVQAKDCLVR